MRTKFIDLLIPSTIGITIAFGLCYFVIVNNKAISLIAALEKIEQASQENSKNLSIAATKIDQIEKDLSLIEKHLQRIDIKLVTVTAYTPRVKECDNDPTNTAMMTKPRIGTVAISRDLFLAGWTFGKKVYLKNIGVFEISDLMNESHKNKIDVLMFDVKKAKKFGTKEVIAAVINYS